MMKTLKTICLFCVLVLCGMCLAGCGKKVKAEPGCAETTIVCGNLYGQGTLLYLEGETALVVTAAHVLEDHTADPREKILVSFSDDTTKFAELLYRSEKRDLALVRTGVSGLSDSVIPARPEKMYPQSAAPVNCYTQGQTHAGSFVSHDTDIRGLGEDLYYILCDVTEGMSGCGVYNEKDGYIGMLIGGDGEGRAGALPTTEIEECIREAGENGQIDFADKILLKNGK